MFGDDGRPSGGIVRSIQPIQHLFTPTKTTNGTFIPFEILNEFLAEKVGGVAGNGSEGIALARRFSVFVSKTYEPYYAAGSTIPTRPLRLEQLWEEFIIPRLEVEPVITATHEVVVSTQESVHKEPTAAPAEFKAVPDNVLFTTFKVYLLHSRKICKTQRIAIDRASDELAFENLVRRDRYNWMGIINDALARYSQDHVMEGVNSPSEALMQ